MGTFSLVNETTAQVPSDSRPSTAPPKVSRTKIVSWAMWDWGTQPFDTVITTFVFSVYLVSESFGTKNFTSQALAVATAIGGIFIALLAPVLGQNADRTGHTVRNLRGLTWALAAISVLLFFVKPHDTPVLSLFGTDVPVYLLLGLTLLATGSVISAIAGVNSNSLLTTISTPSNIGRISGFGWGMGYLGGILVLLAIYFLFIQPDVGLFGVTSAEGMDIRVSMVLCGVWTMIFTIPIFLNLKDTPKIPPASRVGVVESYKELGRSIARIWRRSPHTIYFLMASALFRDGLAGVFAFGAIIAAGTFDFSTGDVIIFGAAANIVAGLSTMGMGLMDDKVGPKRVILISLGTLVALGLAIFFLHDGGTIVFWVCGLLMSACVGPAQSASRSFLARIVPEGRAGEVFGLYATTGRVVSFLAPAMFAVAIGLGHAITGEPNTQYWGILGIVVILLAGFLVMIPVKEKQETIS